MKSEPPDFVPLWLLFAGMCVVSGLAIEAGYRLGGWRRARTTEEKETPVGAMVGSILALFAFLLAFTFGLAAERYEARKRIILDEANAIGTAYLRTRLLPEPQGTESSRLLREYVDVRVRAIQDGRIAEAVIRSEALHGLLWNQAVEAARVRPNEITATYIQALNALIDMHGVRIQVGLRGRIPSVIWLGLTALAVLSMASVGYQAGLSATRRSPAMLVLVLAFSGVVFLIADLNNPLEGFLTVSQEALHDLQASMKADER